MNPTLERKALEDTHVGLVRLMRGVIFLDEQQQPPGQRGVAVEHWGELDRKILDQLTQHEKRS